MGEAMAVGLSARVGASVTGGSVTSLIKRGRPSITPSLVLHAGRISTASATKISPKNVFMPVATHLFVSGRLYWQSLNLQLYKANALAIIDIAQMVVQVGRTERM